METESKTDTMWRSTRLWGVVTILLGAALCVQSYFIYALYQGSMRHGQLASWEQDGGTPQSARQTNAGVTAQQKNEADDAVVDDDKTLKSSTIAALAAPKHKIDKGQGQAMIGGGGIAINGGSPLIQLFGQNDPFDDMAQMRKMMDQMTRGAFGGSFGRGFASVAGGIDDDAVVGANEAFVDKDGNYVVKLDLPGYDKSEIKATINDDTLVISARKNAQTKNSSKNVQRNRFESRQFQSSYMLPGQIDQKKMKITYENGLLTVTVPLERA